jgi:hypothetical protein
MIEETALIGSPITLAELKLPGKLVRWQDIESRLADLTGAKNLLNLYIGWQWQQVQYLRVEGTRLGGDRRIVWLDDRRLRSHPLGKKSIEGTKVSS